MTCLICDGTRVVRDEVSGEPEPCSACRSRSVCVGCGRGECICAQPTRGVVGVGYTAEVASLVGQLTPGEWDITNADCTRQRVCVGVQSGTPEWSGMVNPTERLRKVVRALLLFHSPGPWDAEKSKLWRELTGSNDANTKSLCDAARAALGAT
jgi:hypothetical protein